MAEFVFGMCKTFGCLPSQLLDEDAEILQLLSIVERGAVLEQES